MKTVVFIAPKWKWWTYYYYKDITDYLIKNYWDEFEVIFCNTLKDYLLRHFKKADIIFSIIPFFFKPLWAKKYIFNLHWNYKTERKSKSLWAKLQYLAELNLWFSDNILITSYFLADKLWFRDKYKDKILISPLFLKNIDCRIKKNFHSPLRLLTISSANFLEKWMWVYVLAEQIFKIKDIDVCWTVVLPWNNDNKKVILGKVSKLSRWKNIEYNVLDFVPREKLWELYKENDIFVYATNLDTWWWVIMEACSYWLPVLILPYELWNYIWYPDKFTVDDFERWIKNTLDFYEKRSELSVSFISKFSIEKIIWGGFIDNILKG